MSIKLNFDEKKLSYKMEEKGVELLMVSTRHNIRYMTGGYYYPLYAWDAHTKETQYLSFLCVPMTDISNSFFIGRPGEDAVIKEMELWISGCYESPAIGTKDAAATAVKLLKDKGFSEKRIGLELSSLPADAYEILKEGLPDASFLEIADIMDSLRAVKSTAEIEIIKSGTLLNIEAVEFALKNQAPGVSTAEISEEVSRLFRERGLHYLYSLVCAGPSFFRAASPSRYWENNQILHIDAGALTKGYVVEVCRTGHLGNLADSAEQMMRSCRELEDYVLSRIKHGKLASELQKEADGFLLEHPLGRYGKFVAHGIGMVHHEKPVVNTHSDEHLEAGMVISIEMEFKDKYTGHVKREDMVVITENGCEVILPKKF